MVRFESLMGFLHQKTDNNALNIFELDLKNKYKKEKKNGGAHIQLKYIL